MSKQLLCLGCRTPIIRKDRLDPTLCDICLSGLVLESRRERYWLRGPKNLLSKINGRLNGQKEK